MNKHSVFISFVFTGLICTVCFTGCTVNKVKHRSVAYARFSGHSQKEDTATKKVEDITKELWPTRSVGGITKPDQNPSFTMRLHFRKNSYELSPHAIPHLQNLGKALQNETLRGYVYKIEGHTCDLGSNSYNYELSHKRALAVQRYLTQTFGLPAKQFVIKGYGESQPLVPNFDESARRKNRRVTIINTLKTFYIDNAISEISVQMKRFRNNIEETVQDGDVLTRVDRYSVEFMPEKAMFVYIYQTDATGRTDHIFPNPKFSKISNPVSPGAFYRVPEPGRWFYLDDNTGKEQIIVIALENKLAEPEKILEKILTPTASRGLEKIITEESLILWRRYFIHK